VMGKRGPVASEGDDPELDALPPLHLATPLDNYAYVVVVVVVVVNYCVVVCC
jgi:hypothetical protein